MELGGCVGGSCNICAGVRRGGFGGGAEFLHVIGGKIGEEMRLWYLNIPANFFFGLAQQEYAFGYVGKGSKKLVSELHNDVLYFPFDDVSPRSPPPLSPALFSCVVVLFSLSTLPCCALAVHKLPRSWWLVWRI